jgi:cyclopropane fatty-acyl-phospholipid synthase-like methyltransferase
MFESDPDNERLIDYYGGLLQLHGPSEAALGCTRSKQVIRFAAAARYANFDGKSLVDVGCGFGDFYAYLEAVGKVPREYLGLDIMPEFINKARNMESDGVKFRTADFFREDQLGIVDNVFAFGIFNHLAGRSEREGLDRLDAFLKKATALADQAVIIDFLSDRVDFRRNPEKDRHWSPSEVLEVAGKHSQSVILDHSYLPFEFMLVLHPNRNIDRTDALFCA